MSANQYDLYVAHVRARAPRSNQIAQLVEELVGVVVVEVMFGRFEARRLRPRDGRGVHDATGRIGWTVQAVGADTRGRRHGPQGLERSHHPERAFLIAPAFAVASHVDG